MGHYIIIKASLEHLVSVVDLLDTLFRNILFPVVILFLFQIWADFTVVVVIFLGSDHLLDVFGECVLLSLVIEIDFLRVVVDVTLILGVLRLLFRGGKHIHEIQLRIIGIVNRLVFDVRGTDLAYLLPELLCLDRFLLFERVHGLFQLIVDGGIVHIIGLSFALHSESLRVTFLIVRHELVFV